MKLCANYVFRWRTKIRSFPKILSKEGYKLGCLHHVVWLDKLVHREKKKPPRIRKRKLLWNSLIIRHRKIFGKCLRKVLRMCPQVMSGSAFSHHSVSNLQCALIYWPFQVLRLNQLNRTASIWNCGTTVWLNWHMPQICRTLTCILWPFWGVLVKSTNPISPQRLRAIA